MRHSAVRKLTRIATLGAFFLLLSACNHDTLDGAQIAQEKGCIACHGIDGKGIASIYPNLDGQWQRYLRLQLQAYRDGERENGIMQGMAVALTDEEIIALANHYGR